MSTKPPMNTLTLEQLKTVYPYLSSGELESLVVELFKRLEDAQAPETPEALRGNLVPSGAPLTDGALYEIVEISPNDSSPSHRVGQRLRASSVHLEESRLYLRGDYRDKAQQPVWFADAPPGGTWVSALRLVQE